MRPPRVLTIAGSDPSGGAGMQADLKTFHAHGCYGMAVVTALTAQNTVRVSGVHAVPAEFVEAQLRAIFEDCPPAALKTGMLHDQAIVRAVAGVLRARRAPNVVVDPVMVATSGDRLLDAGAETALATELIPLADLVTPNHAEAQVLTGIEVKDEDSAAEAARAVVALGARAALVKGGHGEGVDAVDVLVRDGADEPILFRSRRVAVGAAHGTGCTLSAAIAAVLARGEGLESAIRTAKAFVQNGLRNAFPVGRGALPVNHLARPAEVGA